MSKIAEMIRRTAVADPTRVAYSLHDGKLTYAELWDRAQRSADLLRRQGNSPVIIYGDKEPLMPIAILACLLAGRTYVPIRSDTPAPRLKRILALTGASLLLTERALDIDGTERCSLAELTRFADREEQARRDDIAYMIFTSGSTGDPKGVPISTSNLENFVAWIGGLQPLSGFQRATVFNQASFSFDLSVADLYYALCYGHTLAALEDDIREDPDGVFRTLSSADVAVMTPTFAQLCLLYDEFRESEAFRLKCIYFCGERLDVKTVRKLFAAFPSLKIVNAYGPTEATSAVSAISITPEMAQTMPMLPVGDVNTFATPIRIEDGEIVLRGKSVFGGYLGAAVGGWSREGGVNCYRTGDHGRIEDGMLFCDGRMDRQVKYKGYRIELDDIEQNIDRIPGVKASAVIAKKNAEGVVRLLKAFVVTDGTTDADRILARLAALVPDYMLPKSIRTVDRLPVNENGKTDRKALETW